MMQNAEGLQLGLLSILRAREKACLRLPDGQYTENELNEQKSWLTEKVESYPGCHIFFYPKYHCELNFIKMV